MFKSNLAVLLFIAISMFSCKNVEEKIPTEENIIEEPQTSDLQDRSMN
ncbi:hypothetical protein [Nonlabens sp. YIK11]|nr:hypothetical protein [Nonlabens sp. YIK11]